MIFANRFYVHDRDSSTLSLRQPLRLPSAVQAASPLTSSHHIRCYGYGHVISVVFFSTFCVHTVWHLCACQDERGKKAAGKWEFGGCAPTPLQFISKYLRFRKVHNLQTPSPPPPSSLLNLYGIMFVVVVVFFGGVAAAVDDNACTFFLHVVSGTFLLLNCIIVFASLLPPLSTIPMNVFE